MAGLPGRDAEHNGGVLALRGGNRAREGAAALVRGRAHRLPADLRVLGSLCVHMGRSGAAGAWVCAMDEKGATDRERPSRAWPEDYRETLIPRGWVNKGKKRGPGLMRGGVPALLYAPNLREH